MNYREYREQKEIKQTIQALIQVPFFYTCSSVFPFVLYAVPVTN